MAYEFDDDFQTKIAALTVRDAAFNLRAEGLILPDYFSNAAEASLVALVLAHWEKYKSIPSTMVVTKLLREAIAKKHIRSDMVDDVKVAFRKIMKADLSDRDYVVDEVAEFAKHQAIIAAMTKGAGLLDKRDFGAIEQAFQQAFTVGASDAGEGHDLLADIVARTERRKETLAGTLKNTVTTGCRELDRRLAGEGFGRKELTVLMGGAKRGKCLTRDTLVLTEDGLVEIGDYIPASLPAGQFAPVALRVLGRDGMECASDVYNNGRSKTIRLTTRRGFTVEGTHNHPMLVRDAHGDLVWRNLEDARLGDQLTVQRGRMVFGRSVDLSGAAAAAQRYWREDARQACTNRIGTPLVMTTEMAEFLAMIVAEGHIGVDGLVTFTQKAGEVFDRYVDLAYSLFGIAPAISERKGSFEARIYSRMLQVYLDALGVRVCNSADKEIPRAIRTAPQVFVETFIGALMGLEGSVVTGVSGKIDYHLCMASERLMRQLHVLLVNFGIVAPLSPKRKCATNGLRVMRTYWSIKIGGQRNLSTLASIGLYERRKQEALEKGLTGVDSTARDRIPNSAGRIGEIMREIQAAGHSLKSLDPTMTRMLRGFRSGGRVMGYAFAEKLVAWLDEHAVGGPGSDWLRGVLAENYAHDEIVRLETDLEAETVDFTVPDTHSFHANGLISHNSFGLLGFGLGAAMAGYNVLHVTLENSTDVTTDRADAALTRIQINDLLKNVSKVDEDVKRKLAKAGVYKIHEYPTGMFAPRDLRRLLEKYRARSVTFDVIIVDYWDIMAPDQHYRDDKIAESNSIGIGLRGIAKQENAVLITAIQTNRDGFRAHTAKAEHAAEDFNKVRLADLLISINSDETERENDDARLYIAEARNTAGGITLNIKQDLKTGIFIDKVVSVGAAA